jgi:hypothetical protein
MKTKTIIGALALGGLAFYLYKRKKDGKSLNPFAKSSSFSGDDKFFNLTQGATCKIYQGSGGDLYQGRIIQGWVDGHGQAGVVVRSSNGTTLICPVGQTSTMPIKYN